MNTVLSNRNLLAVTVTQSLSMFAMFLWRPFWGLYILELDGTKNILGSLTVLQSLSVLLAQLPGGVLSDRMGRKCIIILSQLAVSGSSLRYIISSGFSGVALTRFIGGLRETRRKRDGRHRQPRVAGPRYRDRASRDPRQRAGSNGHPHRLTHRPRSHPQRVPLRERVAAAPLHRQLHLGHPWMAGLLAVGAGVGESHT